LLNRWKLDDEFCGTALLADTADPWSVVFSKKK
jgi:hypothetical protein